MMIKRSFILATIAMCPAIVAGTCPPLPDDPSDITTQCGLYGADKVPDLVKCGIACAPAACCEKDPTNTKCLLFYASCANLQKPAIGGGACDSLSDAPSDITTQCGQYGADKVPDFIKCGIACTDAACCDKDPGNAKCLGYASCANLQKVATGSGTCDSLPEAPSDITAQCGQVGAGKVPNLIKCGIACTNVAIHAGCCFSDPTNAKCAGYAPCENLESVDVDTTKGACDSLSDAPSDITTNCGQYGADKVPDFIKCGIACAPAACCEIDPTNTKCIGYASCSNLETAETGTVTCDSLSDAPSDITTQCGQAGAGKVPDLVKCGIACAPAACCLKDLDNSKCAGYAPCINLQSGSGGQGGDTVKEAACQTARKACLSAADSDLSAENMCIAIEAGCTAGGGLEGVKSALDVLYPSGPPPFADFADPEKMCPLQKQMVPGEAVLKHFGLSITDFFKSDSRYPSASNFDGVDVECLGAPLTALCSAKNGPDCIQEIGKISDVVKQAQQAADSFKTRTAGLKAAFDGATALCKSAYEQCMAAARAAPVGQKEIAAGCETTKTACESVVGASGELTSSVANLDIAGAKTQIKEVSGVAGYVSECFKTGGIDKFMKAGCVPKEAVDDLKDDLRRAQTALAAFSDATTEAVSSGAVPKDSADFAKLKDLGTEAETAVAETAAASSAADESTSPSASAVAAIPQFGIVVACVIAILQL